MNIFLGAQTLDNEAGNTKAMGSIPREFMT